MSLVQGGEEAACEEDGDKERVQRPPPPVSSGDNKEKVEHQQLMAIITWSIKDCGIVGLIALKRERNM